GTMSAQTELLENGSFETWEDGVATNWQSSTSAGNAKVSQSPDARTGEFAVLVKGENSYNKRLAYKELNLKAGTYKMSFYAKGGQVKPGYAISVNGTIDGQTGYKYGDFATLSATEWTPVVYEFTLEASTTINLVVMNPKSNKDKGYTATDAIIDDFSLTTKDGGIDGTVAPPVDITNTPETAYTVAEAFELIEAGQGLNAKVYVKGKISAITEVETTQYFNATYNISDNGTTEGQQLIVYHGKYLGGANFTEEEQINLDDEVIVYGQLVNFKGKYEINSNNQIYSINGVTAGVQNITVEQNNVNAPAFNLAGQRVNAAYKGIVVKNGKKFLNK
ncbi:MAG: carbohydrate binding domain-containing protein, partial [Prevotella sp.]|nr:carbohydrate binding domain-containing protein [Prevotella sp.]